MTKRLLISYAHPDDESFGLGSLIGKYSAEGVEVSLICSTNGDVGTVSPEFMKGYDSVAALRLAELKCASDVLGFKEVITFGYRDSGMMGSDDNNHPSSLWQAPLEKVTDQVLEVIRRIKPQVVITFDPYGGYGHPDHIKMHKATVAAFDIAKNENKVIQKLYYSAFPRLMLRIGVTLMKLQGKDPRKFGSNQDMDLQAVLDATLPIHTRMDVSNYYEVGQKAAECHASQGNPRRAFSLGQVFTRWISRNSALTRVVPPPGPGEKIETDLFEGVVE